jgi:citrate synthase
MSTPAGEAWIDAGEACALLGVKRATLYAYASRGKVQTVPAVGGRRRRYLRDDVLRLVARRDARAGHAAVAAGALRWGEPVLDSAVTEITPAGPRYRGQLASELLDLNFETVAELLWSESGQRPKGPLRWSEHRHRSRGPAGHSAVEAIIGLVVSAGARSLSRQHLGRRPALDAARGLIPAAAARSYPFESRDPIDALEAATVAEAFLCAWGLVPTAKRRRLVDAALISVADHELNPSSFAARVAASTGADLYACILAALATLSGPKHGGAPARIGALLAELARADHAHEVLADRLRRGDAMPGFGHPLYPEGDPRFAPLYVLAREIGTPARMRPIDDLVFTMKIAGGPAPTIDLALVAVTCALGLDVDAASAIFAIGRMAGWIAHALEQREADFILRPRARYHGL